MQHNILDQIAAHKQQEIKALYQQFDMGALRRSVQPSNKNFYRALSEARANGQPFFIAEFKRKSPSEGWINRDADVCAQVQVYARAGAGAISILTDQAFFGGSYTDLQQAAQTLDDNPENRPLLLQKDFILDPIQIYLARRHGAHIILLIAAILPPEQLESLRQTAESLGMGVLVEVHDRDELEKIQHLDFPVLGINNRDLKTFRTALNRVNVLARQAGGRFIVAESGIHDYRDFQIVQKADGFLIGTSLMREDHFDSPRRHGGMEGTLQNDNSPCLRASVVKDSSLAQYRDPQPPILFKACGIRTSELLDLPGPDFIGINFSPVSKRRINMDLLDGQDIPAHAVAVFYQNPETEIKDILARFPFRRVQLYAGDVSPAFIRSLRQKVLLACRVREAADLDMLEAYAPDVDLFILDGAVPGSGTRIAAAIPRDFPYPFLLAGGLNIDNLDAILEYPNCLGVDVASGIETEGEVDEGKMEAIANRLTKMLISDSFVKQKTDTVHME